MFKFNSLVLLVISGLCVAGSAGNQDAPGIRNKQRYVTIIELEDETPQTPTSDPKLKSFTELTEAETPLSLTEESDIEITTESHNLTTADERNTTDTSVIIEHPNESLGSAAIFGIIAGVLLAVVVLSAIIIIIVKKMSGRYSP